MCKELSGVYMIECLPTHEIYIGSSKHVGYRIYGQSISLYHNYNHCRLLQEAYNKYGCDAFEWDICITCNPDYCKYYEQQFLDQWEPELNVNTKSTGGVKHVMTDAIRAKISTANRGRKRSVDTKHKLTRAALGRKHSQETKDKMRQSALSVWNIRKRSD